MSAAGEKTDQPWEKTKDKFNSKNKSEWLDPCQEAASRSIKCLNRNGGDRAMCQDYFQLYRECKKEWVNKRKADKRPGGFI